MTKGNEKAFAEKLKSWFKATPRTSSGTSSSSEISLSSSLLDELSTSSPLSLRLRIINELKDTVRHNKLEEKGVETLFLVTQDLLELSSPSVKMTLFLFYESLIIGQYDRLSLMRPTFFSVIQGYIGESSETLAPCLSLLIALSSNGKNLLYFEEKIGGLLSSLLSLFPLGSTSHKAFCSLCNNVLLFNSAYLDSNVVHLLINYSGFLIENCSEETESALNLLDAIICYNCIPSEDLPHFISALCFAVNIESFGKSAWSITRRLLSTHLSHSTFYTLHRFVCKREKSVFLRRGAVFFIGVSLWGNTSQRVKGLDYAPSVVFSTFGVAISESHPLLLFEVSSQIERLLRGEQGLEGPSMTSLFELLEKLHGSLSRLEDSTVRQSIVLSFHRSLDVIERTLETGAFRDCKEQFFELIHQCSNERSEASVLKFLSYKESLIHSGKAHWIASLSHLLERYFKNESRFEIRVKALSVLSSVSAAESISGAYEEELLDQIFGVFFTSSSSLDESLKRPLSKVLLELLTLFVSKKTSLLLQILEGFLFENSDENLSYYIVEGLIGVFKDKLRQLPTGLFPRILHTLTKYLELNYTSESIRICSRSRYAIFRLFLSLRSENETYYLGIEENDESVFTSPYVVVGGSEDLGEDSLKMIISLSQASSLVTSALEKETDWNVLALLLTHLPSSLHNKALICRSGKSLNKLLTSLVGLMDSNPTVPTSLLNTPSKFTRNDFHNHILPVLAALSSYNEFLDPLCQTTLIRTLELGLLSRECNRMCIVALTASALQMKRSMYHIIPEVLGNISKISVTKAIATPILEFLSTIVCLPEVFSSFTDTNYITIFAIVLPVTNPFKFDTTTVSLAHHVIVMWFLKCRLAYRQNVVQFIIASLNSNVIAPFEDLNMDSSTEKRRTSSLGSSRPPLKQMNFHRELTETCLDILARYMYGNVSVKANRLQSSNFILKSGHSASWLVGNMIVTVSTSCCTHIATRSSLCDPCVFNCLKNQDGSNNTSKKDSEFSESRSKNENSVHQICSCWCSGWAEIYIRRPSGDVSWVCRVQNTQLVSSHAKSTNLHELTALFNCSLGAPNLDPEEKIDVENLSETEYNHLFDTQKSEPNVKVIVKETKSSPLAVGEDSLPNRCDPIPENDESSGNLKFVSRKSLPPTPIPPLYTSQIESLNVPNVRSVRSYTISVTAPRKFPEKYGAYHRPGASGNERCERVSGISPQFIFLMFYQSSPFKNEPSSGSERPLLLPPGEDTERSLRNLDRIPAHETHKIGVLYIGPTQLHDEVGILRNISGSVRYTDFISGLGNLIDIRNVDRTAHYLGGLSSSDGDGDFAIMWEDDIMQVIFHVATLMPNRERDPKGNSKKRHIGNDYVVIVYNDSGNLEESYQMNTVKGEFISAIIVITPLSQGSNKVVVLCKEELREHLGHVLDSKIVSDKSLSILVRQWALHCSLALQIHKSLSSVNLYSSNWLERLRAIKRIRYNLLKGRPGVEEGGNKNPGNKLYDFTEYVKQKSSKS